MKLGKRMNHYLKGNIDFSAFYILEVIPQNLKYAVVLLAPTKNSPYSYFNLQYMDKNLYYHSIEKMMEHCVDYGYVSSLRSKIIILRFNRTKKKLK